MKYNEHLKSLGGKPMSECVAYLVKQLAALEERVETLEISGVDKEDVFELGNLGLEEEEVEHKPKKKREPTPEVILPPRPKQILPLPALAPLPPQDALVQPDKLVHLEGAVLVCLECHEPSVRVNRDILGSTKLDLWKDFTPIIGGWGDQIQTSNMAGFWIQCPACGNCRVPVVNREPKNA